MDMFTSVAAAAILILAVCLHCKFTHKDFPPGPYGLPLLGSSLFMGKYPHAYFKELSKKYGSIFSISFGTSPTVVVNDWASVKEVLKQQGDTFGARPFMFNLNITFGGQVDIVNGQGKAWKEHKRYMLKTLRDLGMGRSSLHEVIMEEVDSLTKHLQAQSGETVDITVMFFNPIMNIIWSITAGRTFDNSDKNLKQFQEAFHNLASFSNVRLLTIWPCLRFVVPRWTGYTKFSRSADIMHSYVGAQIDKHLEHVDSHHMNDIIDTYLKDIDRNRVDGIERRPFDRKSLNGAIANIFLAGVETTDTVLSWAILYMVIRPDIQEKVQAELDKHVPHHSFLLPTSRSLLPYTEATLLEIQRIAAVLPLGVPHSPNADATLLGYRIPKGTQVLYNMWAVHHDERYWGDPESFRPERFLDEDGKVMKHECLIPFGAGPRVCLGESLARSMLFLFFTCLLHRFSFQPTPGGPIPSLEPVVGIVLRPQPFSCAIKPRY